MQKFTLDILFHIIGIGSASGIIYKDNTVYLISDSGSSLYNYHIKEQKLGKIQLFENAVSENIPKKLKADFEAIANHEDDYYIFGSGSTENRNNMVHYNAVTQQTTTVDLTFLYAAMQSFSAINAKDFNIEGVVYDGKTWYFFQRGNGKKGHNGIFTVNGKNLENDFTILFNPFKLPKINGIASSFTDATMVGNSIYFLATAEATNSTYQDGEVFGSLIGRLNPDSMQIDFTQKITDSKKLEGITLYKDSENQIEFLLCEDNDTEIQESSIYKITLQK